MQNLISKAAGKLAKILDTLTPEQREAAVAWAVEKLGGHVTKRRRKARKAKATAEVAKGKPSAPAPAKAAAKASPRPVSRTPVRATDDDEDDE